MLPFKRTWEATDNITPYPDSPKNPHSKKPKTVSLSELMPSTMEEIEAALEHHSFPDDELSFTNNFSGLSLSPLQKLTVFQDTAAKTSAMSKKMDATGSFFAFSKDFCDKHSTESVGNDQRGGMDLSVQINFSAQALSASSKRSVCAAFENELYCSNKKPKPHTSGEGFQLSSLLPQVYLVNKATEHLKRIVDQMPGNDKEAFIRSDKTSDFQNDNVQELRSSFPEALEDQKQSGLASPFEYQDDRVPLFGNLDSKFLESKNNSYACDGILIIDKTPTSKPVSTKQDIASSPVTATSRIQNSSRKLGKENSNHILRRRIPREPREIGALVSCGPVSAVKADLNHIVEIRTTSGQTLSKSLVIARSVETASLVMSAPNRILYGKAHYRKYPFLRLPPSTIPEFHTTSRAIGNVTTLKPSLGPRSGTLVPLDRLFVASKKTPATSFLAWARGLVFGFSRPVYLDDAGVPYVVYDSLPPCISHTEQRADSPFLHKPLPL